MQLHWEDNGINVLTPVLEGLAMTLRFYGKGNKELGFAELKAFHSCLKQVISIWCGLSVIISRLVRID